LCCFLSVGRKFKINLLQFIRSDPSKFHYERYAIGRQWQNQLSCMWISLLLTKPLLYYIAFPHPEAGENYQWKDYPAHHRSRLWYGRYRTIYIAHDRYTRQNVKPPDDLPFSRCFHIVMLLMKHE
jgi:hypothetical protein